VSDTAGGRLAAGIKRLAERGARLAPLAKTYQARWTAAYQAPSAAGRNRCLTPQAGGLTPDTVGDGGRLAAGIKLLAERGAHLAPLAWLVVSEHRLLGTVH
jgi:hypothetical protein